MAKIRIVRVLEYVYEDVATMEADMGRWGIAANGHYRPNSKLTIKSATLPVETFAEVALLGEPDPAPSHDAYGDAGWTA